MMSLENIQFDFSQDLSSNCILSLIWLVAMDMWFLVSYDFFDYPPSLRLISMAIRSKSSNSHLEDKP